LSRYPGYFRGLLSSPSKEVRILARKVEDDARFPTCRNLRFLRQKTLLQQVESYSSWRVNDALGMQKIPEHEKWRLGLLTSLDKMRQGRQNRVLESKQLCGMIDSLNST
jgi:hypothetical protein